MTSQVRGFATLAALSIMLLLVGYLSVNASALAQNQLELGRHSDQQAQKAAWAALDAALKSVSTWDPSRERLSAWAKGSTVPDVEWQSLSGRINLNTVTPFVLELPELQASLSGTTVQQFIDTRAKAGPARDLQAYAKQFAKDSLADWYTVDSCWNINTSDEVMLEQVVGTRLSSPASGSAVRSLVRSLRMQKKRLSAAEWQQQMGTNTARLGSLVTTEPELDVNEVPAVLLRALITNPDWSIEQADKKAQQLLALRESRPLDLKAIQQILGVPGDHIALAYLGGTTSFARVAVATPTGVLSAIVRFAGAEGIPKPTVVSTSWTAL